MPYRTAHPSLVGFISTGRVKRICRAAMGHYAIRRTHLVVRAKKRAPTEADAPPNCLPGSVIKRAPAERCCLATEAQRATAHNFEKLAAVYDGKITTLRFGKRRG